jgi:bacterioferritin-associated ferredoxin
MSKEDQPDMWEHISDQIDNSDIFLSDHTYLDSLKQHLAALRELESQAQHQAGCGCCTCKTKYELAKEKTREANAKYAAEYHRQNQFHQDQEELFIEADALARLNKRLEDKRAKGETSDE